MLKKFVLVILVSMISSTISAAPKNVPKQDIKNIGEQFKMDEAKVIGFLENPQAVYILDYADSTFRPLLLDRSFKDLMIANIDKETFQRLYDDKIKPEQ